MVISPKECEAPLIFYLLKAKTAKASRSEAFAVFALRKGSRCEPFLRASLKLTRTEEVANHHVPPASGRDMMISYSYITKLVIANS
jgi:hypothetical protein